MDAYIINLDSSKDRWESCKRHFKGSYLRLHRFPAVEHSNGAYGLLLTTISLLQMAQSKHLPYLLYLEDDCIPSPDWESRWKTLKHWLDTHPDTWDIYSGGSWGGSDIFQSFTNFIGLHPKEVGKVKDNTIVQYPFVSNGAHWIYIPKRSYKKVIDSYEAYSFLTKYMKYMSTDIYNGLFFRTVTSYPFIVYQQSSYSIVNKKYIPRENIIKKHEKRLGTHLTRKNKRSTIN